MRWSCLEKECEFSAANYISSVQESWIRFKVGRNKKEAPMGQNRCGQVGGFKRGVRNVGSRVSFALSRYGTDVIWTSVTRN